MTLPSRRQLLARCGAGLGSLALADLLGRQGLLAADPNPLAAKKSHFAAKAKAVIWIFVNGGHSQVDTWDYKPELAKLDGKPLPNFDKTTGFFPGQVGPLMKSPFAWKQHGQCGRWVTDVFPHLAGHVDNLAFLMALASKSSVHGPAAYLQTTGFVTPGFPAAGAWVGYALGRLADDLPAFVVLPDPRGLPYNGNGNFSAGFLPAQHAGTVVNPAAASPIPDLAPPKSAAFVTPAASADGLDLLQQMNRQYAAERPGDSRLSARVESYELAAKMQLAAPEVFDLSKETKETHTAYGTDRKGADGGFARNCLLARRMLAKGVRFVQVWSGAGGPANNWDNHTDIIKELPAIARQVDQPTAALLLDLKQRGLLADTLVVCSTEFGRQPFTQGATGRDHNQGTSIAWLAGAGIKGGTAYGTSDEWSWRAAEGKLYSYDVHATVLHLLGIDHEKLTVRHDGIDRRITDVHGHVVKEVLS